MLYRFYKKPLLSEAKAAGLSVKLGVKGIRTEKVFCVESLKELSKRELENLRWLLADIYEPNNLSRKSFLGSEAIEVGPSLNFETSNSTNAVSICHSCGLKNIIRLEEGRRYLVAGRHTISAKEIELMLPFLHDEANEDYYSNGLISFATSKKAERLKYIPVMEKGMEALRMANEKYGAGMDEEDLNYYLYLCRDLMKRNPTDAEFRDLGNTNSEHSRHHRFRAKLIIDGKEIPFTLMELIKSTLKNKENSVIAFGDNSSSIFGHRVSVLIPERPGFPSPVRMAELLYHYVLTCETHNHPCYIFAYAGAGTGGGGRRRDNQAVGRGGIVVAGSTGFLGGNLYLPNYHLSWEDPSFHYDPHKESPLSFFINATNGAFDDGNQFGEPVILGFAESFGMRIGKERWEYAKPVMFSGGFGFMDDQHKKKRKPILGMLVVKMGGKGFRIGEGGSSASSMIQGENKINLDKKSTQRADGEMAKKTDAVLQTCIQMGDKNPIESIHDQGAGGNGNVLKELIEPLGGKIHLRKIILGDKTMSAAEIWVAEYQENLALLINPDRWEEFKAICEREKAPVSIVGTITGDGKVVVIDEKNKTIPIDLELKKVLGDYPQKTFCDNRRTLDIAPIDIPDGLDVRQSIEMVFRLLGIASKEWMVHKVDRSVTGKVVQQQCVGPLQIPLSNYSVIAPSPFGFNGEANSIGLRPTIGLISPESMSRMSVADSLIKLMFVAVNGIENIKASANWMLAAKIPGGMAWLYYAVKALVDSLEKVEVDIDGGKDSLSMAATIPLPDGEKEIVCSPGTLVFSTYADCPDYRKRVTPDIKKPGESKLIFVDLAQGKTRLGGSALAQVLKQIGNSCPDADDLNLLKKVFGSIQKLIQENLILAGHKKGRGGLLTTLSEMSFSGNCGIKIHLEHEDSEKSAIEALWNEELGFVIECLPENEGIIFSELEKAGLDKKYIQSIGCASKEKQIRIIFNHEVVVDEDMRKLRDIWRDTSYQMDLQQNIKSCVESERRNNYDRIGPQYRLGFDPDMYSSTVVDYPGKIPVAIIREEGTNSDEEAIAACFLAGLQPYDVTLTDIEAGRITLRNFRIVVIPGGFSYKDVLGSAKGFAGVIKFNAKVMQEFNEFFARPDTLSLGICNGCQLMVILGIVPWKMPEIFQPALVRNVSEKFESRFVSVRIFPSPSIMLKGMEGSILGIHVAHGEGRFLTKNKSLLNKIISKNLAPVRFVDDYGNPTEEYPFNPNGSPLGISALCSEDGRHLAIMPHPERTALRHRWHYWPEEWEKIKNSPWLRMLQNARISCEKTRG